MMRNVSILAVAFTLTVTTLAAAQGQRAVEQGPAPELPRTLKAAAPIDLTGTWVSVVTEDWRWRMVTPPRYDYAAIPLNSEGRKVADNWDAKADDAGGLQCKVYGAASVMRMPGRLNIAWLDDDALQVKFDAGTQERVLRYGGKPAQGAPTWQGQSSALWELPVSSTPGVAARGRAGQAPSGALKVVTTNMRAGYLRMNGVPYSDKAVLT